MFEASTKTWVGVWGGLSRVSIRAVAKNNKRRSIPGGWPVHELCVHNVKQIIGMRNVAKMLVMTNTKHNACTCVKSDRNPIIKM